MLSIRCVCNTVCHISPDTAARLLLRIIELGYKLATDRSRRGSFEDPWSFGLAGTVASISSIDIQREALPLTAPTKRRARNEERSTKPGPSRHRFSSCFEAGRTQAGRFIR